MTQVPTLSASELRGVSDVLGETNDWFSNREVNELLDEAGIEDPTPSAPSGMYNAVNKRTRLFNALKARQDQDRSPKARKRTRRLRGDLEARMSTQGSSALATRRSEMRITFTSYLRRPRVSPRRSGKSLGWTPTGAPSSATPSATRRALPRLAWNSLQTEADRSEQRGLTNLCRGAVGAFRNPTAHEPKVPGWSPRPKRWMSAHSCRCLSTTGRRDPGPRITLGKHPRQSVSANGIARDLADLRLRG
jgi:uncharacterized protein Ymh